MKRILVIEDHKMFSSHIAELILSMYPKAHIFQARDGREGVKMAMAEKPDVILLDMHLPVMDGYETARTLQSMPDTRGIPLIGMTLLLNEESQTLNSLRRFCKAILFKPFQAVQLAAVIRQIGI